MAEREREFERMNTTTNSIQQWEMKEFYLISNRVLFI